MAANLTVTLQSIDDKKYIVARDWCRNRVWFRQFADTDKSVVYVPVWGRQIVFMISHLKGERAWRDIPKENAAD